ncbi:MAG: DUF4870 domain-containing protein [Bacteroidales bacterium]|nr:DUF4870 domain-containing protein [Bacteroidales bacterium]
MNYDDLKALDELRKNGAITEEEYQAEKQKILNQIHSQSAKKPLFGMSENSYIALMHLSQFAGYLIPFLGFIAPVVLWLLNKDENIKVDRNGKNIINFMLSWLIYFICAGILVFLLIGIPIAIALGIMQIVFIIMAALKAMDGEYWKYPLSLTILK